MALRPKSKNKLATKKKKPVRKASKGYTRRKAKKSRFSWRGLAVKLGLWGLLIALLAGGLYVWHLSATIESRFAGRRWSLPSRVYADSMMLFVGQEYSKTQVLNSLKVLGYRRVNKRNLTPGQYRAISRGLDVYLRPMILPGRKQQAMAIRLIFNKNGIASLGRLDDGRAPGVVELEPRPVAQFFGPERESRIVVSLAKIPPHLPRAFLAAEDADFYKHHGVDIPGILRAFWVNLWAGGIRQGGSTITQQLAKNYFLTPERTLWRKIRELIIAVILELKYSKDTILEIYLNEVYLGQMGSVAVSGVGEAAHFYFGKPAEELDPAESALLAAVLRGPNYYSPHRHAKRAKERRDWVLGQMAERGWLQEAALQKARRAPLGLAPYKKYRRGAPYFVDYVSRQLKELYPQEALASLGLGIYTTLDMEVQAAAERALSLGLERLEKARPKLRSKNPAKRLQGAIIVMQPQTGNILAMVGGRDYSESQFNRATQAYRQPGSTFKPFVYLAALDEFTPASALSNQRRVYKMGGKKWRPANYKPYPAQTVSLRTALAKSLNLPTVDLAMKVGLTRVAAVARGFGFEGEMKPYPSLALGALEVRPLELARAYCAFAADGVLPYPLSVHKVADENGQVAHRRHVSKESVTTPAKAYMMDSLLRSVVLNGTGQGLGRRGISLPAAGKTGTTNDYRDAWFVGYTPDILALVWVGFDDNRSVGFSGGGAALPIWAELIKAIPWRTSGSWFRKPPGVVTAWVCADSGQAPASGCHQVVEELFLQSNVPRERCQLHGGDNSVENVMRSISNAVREFFN
jgi:penicillin-binding protein 1B